MTTQVRNPELVNLLKADFINCWIPVAQSVLTAPAATVTLANIPGTYRALAFMLQLRTDGATEADWIYWRANGDGGANYDFVCLYGRGDGMMASTSNLGTNQAFIGWTEGANSRASNFSPFVIWFPGYALADREKWSLANSSVMGDVSVNTDVFIHQGGGRWRNTAAITSVTFLKAIGANFVAGSRFALYGIL